MTGILPTVSIVEREDSPPSLQEFIALAKKASFSRTDRFQVEFSVPPAMPASNWNSRDLALLCEETVFPGKVLRTRDLRINALTERRAHTLDYLGDSVGFTFLVDTSWQTRLFFETWLQLCIGSSPTSEASAKVRPLREVEFYNNYIQDIKITALTPIGEGNQRPFNEVTNEFLKSSVVRDVQQSLNPNELKHGIRRILEDQTNRIPGNVLGQSVGRIVREGVIYPAERTLGILPEVKGVKERPFSVAEKPIFQLILHEAFPVALDAQPMSSNAVNQFHRLRVGFVFKWYSVPGVDTNVNPETGVDVIQRMSNLPTSF